MKEPKKSQSEYIKNNFENKTLKELSEDTGLTVSQIKKIIEQENNKSIDKIIEETVKEETKEPVKRKKISKYIVSADGNSVIMSPIQSVINDKMRDKLGNKKDPLAKYRNDIGIIKQEGE